MPKVPIDTLDQNMTLHDSRHRKHEARALKTHKRSTPSQEVITIDQFNGSTNTVSGAR